MPKYLLAYHGGGMPQSDEEKARILLSRVPEQKTTPPAVTVAPPMFSVPVFGTPALVSSECSPNGTRQSNRPELRSMQLSEPQGGLIPG